ncbi:MAG: exodeoxyribonuclease III [Steroidobacteraceae bacterium]|jgi:exodeoxyribonuclease-3
MRIVTFNANGIRSAASKGFFKWLPAANADVICIQETKAQVAQLTDRVFWPQGYDCHYFDAEKKGYSGTALYARKPPVRVNRGFGVAEFDREGRYLEAHFGHMSIVSLYLPSGSAGPERQASKYRFLEAFMPHLRKLQRRKVPYILCGDWNIAHKPIDLKNWKSNQKNSGFLPEERQWLDELFGRGRFVDAFRETNTEADQYTWWSNRGQAYAKNVGWRIDYHIATAALRGRVKNARIFKDQRFSDHAPLIIDYEFEF